MYQLITETDSLRINHGVFQTDEDVMAYLQKLYEDDDTFDLDGNTDIQIRKVDPAANKGPYDTPVRDLLSRLKAAGFALQWVDDGEAIYHGVDTVEYAADYILSVDESHLGIKKNDHALWLFLVLGNGKEEIVSDYTYRDCPEHKELEAVLDDFYQRWIPAERPIYNIED